MTDVKIKVTADIDQAQNELRTIPRTMEDVGDSAKKAANGAGMLKGAFAAIAGIVTVGMLKNFIRDAIDAADETSKLSQKMGVTVSDVAGLQLAFRQAGLGAAEMQVGVAQLSRNMAEGNQAFVAMGISTRKADGSLRSTRDILGEVAGKFSEYEDGAGKTALAMELFGRSGAEMIPLLNGGAEALDEYDRIAKQLGLTLDEETAKSAEKFNDTLDLVGQGTKGIAMQVAGDLLPTLNNLAGQFLTSMTEGDRLAKVADGISLAFRGLYSIGVGIVEVFRTVGTGIGGVVAAVMDVLHGDFSLAKETLAGMKTEIADSWARAARSISDAWADTETPAGHALAAIAGAAKAAAPEIKAVENATKAAKTAASDFLDHLDFLTTFNTMDLSGKLDASISGDDDFLGIQAHFEESYGPGSDFARGFKKLMADTFGPGWQEAGEAAKKSTKEVSDAYKHMMENIQDASADMFKTLLRGEIKNLKDAGDLLLNYSRDIISEIGALAIRDGKGIVGAFKDIFTSVIDIATNFFSTMKALWASNPYMLIIGGILAGGYALSESMGGGLAKDTWKYATGKGTVLGDAELESESIAHSLEILNDTNEGSHGELQSIRAEMVKLNANITGLVLNILHGSNGYNAGALGVDVGKLASPLSGNVGGIWAAEAFGALSSLAANTFQQIGGFLGNMTEWVSGGTTKRQLLSAGIQTGGVSIGELLAGGDADTTGFERHRTTKSGMFGSSSSKIYTGAFDLDASVTNMFDQLYRSMGETMVELAKGLGTDNMAEVMAYMFDVSKIDLKDLSGEEISAKISAWISAEGDKAIDTLFGELVTKYQRLDEGLLETAVRLIADKDGVMAGLKLTGQTFSGTAREAIEFSQRLIEIAGSLDALTAATATYYDKFYSDSEKFGDLTNGLSASLGALDQTLPASRAGFRALVQGIDLSTDAGKELRVALLALSGSAGDYYNTLESREKSKNQLLVEQLDLEGNTAEATALSRKMRLDELSAIDASLVTIQERIYALQDENAASAAAASIASERSGLERELLELQGDTAAIRELERSALDESNRALYDRINTLKDEQAATAAAAEAARELATQLLNIQAVQMKIHGTAPDDIRMAQIAARYGWEGKYLVNGEYDWAGIQANLANFAGYAPEKAQRGLSGMSERLGVSVQDILSDIDFIWDQIGKQSEPAAEEVETFFDRATSSASDAAKTLIKNQIDMLKETASSLKPIFDLLRSEVASLYGESETAMTAAAGNVFVSRALALAKSTGALPDRDALAEAIGAARSGLDAGNYSTALELERDRLVLAGKLSALRDISGEQLSAAERQIEALERINDSVGSVEAAIKAIAGIMADGPEMPGFASGGYHYGGLRIVGERGPEIEATGPAMYYSAQQAAAMIHAGGRGGDNSELIARIDALREENKAQARSIAVLQSRLVKLLERWDGDGMPEERAAG